MDNTDQIRLLYYKLSRQQGAVLVLLLYRFKLMYEEEVSFLFYFLRNGFLQSRASIPLSEKRACYTRFLKYAHASNSNSLNDPEIS
jgi:hypothetical protein